MAVSISKDTISGVVLIILALCLYFYLIPVYVADSQNGGISPQFFPKLGSILIGIGGAILTLSSLRVKPSVEQNKTAISSHNFIRPALLVGVLSAFIILFEFLGYFYAAPVLIALNMLVFGARKPLTVILATVIVTATIYVVFTYGLNLPLE